MLLQNANMPKNVKNTKEEAKKKAAKVSLSLFLTALFNVF